MDEADNQIPTSFRRSLKALASAGVDFVVCGGVACVLQGTSRSTQDIDICLRMDRENVLRFIEVARSLGLQPRAPVPIEQLADDRTRTQWVRDRGALVFTLNSRAGPLQLDVFLDYPIPFDRLCSHADIIHVDSVPVLVSSKPDLIEAKRRVTPLRRRDQRDIEDLQELIQREQQP